MTARRIQAYLNPTNLFYSTPAAPAVVSRPAVSTAVPDESDYYSSSHGSSSEASDAPLRFIIIRHGERVDVVYGPGWTKRVFNAAGQYFPIDANMPPALPPRSNLLDYDVDTPLTNKGLSQSWNVGNALARYNLPVTACYSSPAFRSIQTADRILEGMGRKGHVPLRLELGLFELTSWYANSPIHFMSDEELLAAGYPVDTHYRSQVSDLRLMENEYQYYDRSKEAMKKIIRLHRKTGGTILLVGHAPSLEVLTRHLMNGQPRPERLAELAGKVDFCSMTIVERESSSKPWQFRYSLDNQGPQSQWQQQQVDYSKGQLNRSKSAAVTPAAVVYQPPSTFTNYLGKAPTTPTTPFQFFPVQESYPPYFVLQS